MELLNAKTTTNSTSAIDVFVKKIVIKTAPSCFNFLNTNNPLTPIEMKKLGALTCITLSDERFFARSFRIKGYEHSASQETASHQVDSRAAHCQEQTLSRRQGD
jgi:hypothetical protein